MNYRRAVELLQLYAVCPDCGSDRLGEQAGSINITETEFIRTCECGFSVEIYEEST